MATQKTYVHEVKFCAQCGGEMVVKDAYGFDRQTGQKLREAQCSNALAMSEEEKRTTSGLYAYHRHDYAREQQGGGWEVSHSW